MPHPTVRQAAAFRRTARRRAGKRAGAPAAPGLPADPIGSPRGAQPKAPDGDQATAAGRAQPAADDSPVLSFGPPSAGVQPAVEDRTIAYPTEPAVKSASDDTVASGAP